MRKLITTFATAGVLGLSAITASNAAPVPGFEAQYAAVLAACTPPAGTPAACEAAINALSTAMIAAGVPQAVALRSFTELRTEVVAAGGFEAVFEELLPESGATATPVAGAPVAAEGTPSGEAPPPPASPS